MPSQKLPISQCRTDLLLAAAVVFFAYLVRGVNTGFGSALVAVPLLVQMLPLTTVVPFIATLDVVAAWC